MSAPETYCGVPVPPALAPNWDQPEVGWWRLGVKAAMREAADYAAEARAATLREAAEIIRTSKHLRSWTDDHMSDIEEAAWVLQNEAEEENQ